MSTVSTAPDRQLKKEKLDEYLEICGLLKRLPPLYVTCPWGTACRARRWLWKCFFELVNHFSTAADSTGLVNDDTILERLAEITAYIEEHHREKITLEDIASNFYLSREYFSRFFRQNMGGDIFTLCKPSEADAYLP